MNIVNCLYPKVIKNPYTGDRIACGCGKCDACLNQRANLWVKRLDMESSCHKYTLFCTLTYADNDVPQVIRLRKEDSSSPAYIDGETGEIFDMTDVKRTFNEKDKQYIWDTKVLDVLNKKDFQDFIKRLRSRFNSIEKGAKLRYYLSAEYGSTTYRPHGHLLLFFDSEKCSRKIELLLRASWQHGDVYDPHFVNGSASKYCAKYVNSMYSLPKCYLHKGFRPFSLFSKNPSIGSCYGSIQDKQKLFETGSTSFKRLDKYHTQFVDEPLWRSFENRLYPRCQRFGSLSYSDRVRLYRKVAEFPSTLDATTVAKRIESEYIVSKRTDFFGRYFYEISHKYEHGIRLYVDKVNPFGSLPWLPFNTFVPQNFVGLKTETRPYCFDSLVRFVRTCRQLIKNCTEFGCTIEHYISKIDSYYDLKYQKKVHDDYDGQSEFFRFNPSWYAIYLDYTFYKRVTTFDFDSLSEGYRSTLLYMFDGSVPLKNHLSSDGKETKTLDIPPYESLFFYQSFKTLHQKIAHDSVKQKKNNSYALAHKDKFGNILRFQND